MTGSLLRFYLYSEDCRDARSRYGLLKEFLLWMLKLIDPALKTHHVRECVFPLSDAAMNIYGSYWKMYESKRPGDRKKRDDLLNDVVTEIARGSVVVFHVDADAVWSASATAEVHRHLERLRNDIRIRISKLNPERAASLDAWLIIALPHWCIESWVYANTNRLRRLVKSEAERRAVGRWEEDLARLDEEPEIKEALPSVRDQHSLELVEPGSGFPAAKLRAARTSWETTVERLELSESVSVFLESLRQLPY